MLLRKTTWFWKSGLAAISFVLILSISGCSDAPPEENTVSETVIDVQAIQEESEEDADEIISVCIDLYEKVEEENKLADLETIRSIVNRLGENGYSAVDSRNQINMTDPEKVVEFCEKVDAQEEAEITILEVSYLGGFVKYDLHTKGGNVDVVRSYYKYEDGGLQREVTGSYQAEYWNYTEEGYLMFSGVWFSEELYVLTLSGAEEHTALRVQPLDETYRELSRKYLNPISFERNNMFIVDWSEEDFGDLNFYDMYDILYPKVNGQYAPYVADDNLSVSAVYQIPKEEFESVIDFMKEVPTEWDESRFVDGYPGKYVVLARRHGDSWYLAAVNATKEPLKLKLDLPMFAGKSVSFYSDDKQLQPQLRQYNVKSDGKFQLTIQPQGGVVLKNN